MKLRPMMYVCPKLAQKGYKRKHGRVARSFIGSCVSNIIWKGRIDGITINRREFLKMVITTDLEASRFSDAEKGLKAKSNTMCGFFSQTIPAVFV